MSVQDARISTSLPSHPKTKKLIRRLGTPAAWYLVRLFLWASANRSDGDLHDLTDEDIELAIDWPGKVGELISGLAEVGFLEGNEGGRSIHDWAEHNPWAAGADARSEASKWAALCKRYGQNGATARMPDYAARMRAAREPDAGRTEPHHESHAPIPIPIPIPEHEPKGSSASANAKAPRSKIDPIPYQAIADLYNATMRDLPKVRALTPGRRAAIRTAWNASPTWRSLRFFTAYFAECQEEDFLNGSGPYIEPHANWRPDFDYLLKAKTITKIYERAMDRLEREA